MARAGGGFKFIPCCKFQKNQWGFGRYQQKIKYHIYLSALLFLGAKNNKNIHT